MRPGKIRSLSVRPYKSADLAFATPGILGRQGNQTLLGAAVASSAALLESIQQRLHERVAGGDRKGSLAATAQSIEGELACSALFVQANGKLGAEIDQAIAKHRSLYLQNFADSAAIGPILRANNAARQQDTLDLQQRVETRYQALRQSYAASHAAVVTSTTSESRHAGDVAPVTKTYSAPLQVQTESYKITIGGGGLPAAMVHTVDPVVANPKVFKNGAFQPITEELAVDMNAGGSYAGTRGVLTQVSETLQKPVLTTTEMPSHAYPSADEDIGSRSALVDLAAGRKDLEVESLQLLHFESIVDAEDEALVLDVRMRQLAFLDTFLVAPFAGRITAIFKDVGEFVQAGEPVLRIESDERLRLVGLIQFKGLVGVGDQVALKVRNIFEGGDELRMTGSVVSVRGHDADDDEWDLIIDIENYSGQQLSHPDGSVETIHLPLNVQFDRFETEIALGRP